LTQTPPRLPLPDRPVGAAETFAAGVERHAVSLPAIEG
jgi:hypothetical protein